MAWNPSPKVADCRDVARKWNVQQVIILGFNYKNGTFEIASFGETRALCADAKAIGEAIFKQIEDGTIAPQPRTAPAPPAKGPAESVAKQAVLDAVFQPLK